MFKKKVHNKISHDECELSTSWKTHTNTLSNFAIYYFPQNLHCGFCLTVVSVCMCFCLFFQFILLDEVFNNPYILRCAFILPVCASSLGWLV